MRPGRKTVTYRSDFEHVRLVDISISSDNNIVCFLNLINSVSSHDLLILACVGKV